jgi:hypothetical protein
MKHKISFGTVQSGTMRNEDLIPAFMDELRWLDSENITLSEIDEKLNKMEDDQLSEYWNTEDADYDREALEDDLNNECENMPYAYFGSHPGDGADFGFWIDSYAVEDAISNGEIKSVEDLSELEDDYEGEVVVASDHGNMTLYNVFQGKLTEIWGIV